MSLLLILYLLLILHVNLTLPVLHVLENSALLHWVVIFEVPGDHFLLSLLG